ncbi:N-acyl homoserine lactonase family protein [Tengunoibacter tsumagoiensis]|uniref:N-acyl homoserine lactonase n=1 Tax=Tengunoibacter tsumagoiensis TaxID=2014871 RepID=A0A401ZZL1_9CHLR|nr:N-acyl homoserine lactonase family protein [Tengunoibacter tsumagoiensis]GCE12232.1 N-acyl homoserine lactonase [Tengunoibacter tsumagoiensis]
MSNIHPQRLYLLQLASANVPLGAGRTMEMIQGCYVIEMSNGQHILIDSGMPSDVPQPGQDESTVLKQLAALDLSPADIDFLVCTHFDIDHAGYHDHFPGAELIVQREHYTLARSGHPRYAGARSHWDHPELRYRLIDGDSELVPGVRLLETSGHAPGHQSVLVNLPQSGPVLLAIDAVMMERLFTVERKAWPMDDNEEQLRASTQKLLDIVEREQVSLVVFGHDGQQWKTLKKAPDYYE